jgi:cardiolipin synthase A/B
MNEAQKTRIELYSGTRKAWEVMYEDCLTAAQSIEFEQYIIRNDDNGRQFMTMVAGKARDGVNVKLLLERVGSRHLYGSGMVRDIVKNGGTVDFYNSISWLNLFAPSTWLPRNHSKIMVIDSKIAHIGSACIADYMAAWRDLHARISGGLVSKIAGGTPDDADFDYMVAKPHLTPSPIYRELLARINRATKSVYMATPYLLAPGGLRRALRRAARRGVDVRIIVTETTDVPFAVYVSRSFFPRLLKEGIRLFSYKGAVYHAKYSIIDGQWATMGSANLDYLSLLRNREANIVMTHPGTVRQLESQFLGDLGHCVEIRPDFWRSVPLREKIIGYLGRLVKRMI